MNRRTRVLSLFALVLVAMMVLVPVASAYDGRNGDRIVIGKDEVVDDDLFAGGTTLIVDGTVNGDVVAAGQTVTVNGKVTGNVIAAGSAVVVNGQVGHDVIAAGAAVTLGPDARIGHNVYAAGSSVESKAGGRIGGSLILAAGQGLVSGQIANDLAAGAGRLRLEGTVGRNAKLAADTSAKGYSPNYYNGPGGPAMPSVPAGLTFGPEARVGRALEYVSQEPVEIPASVSTLVTHTLPPHDEQLSRELAQKQSASSYLFDAVRRLVSLLVVGLLVAWLAPRWITGPADRLHAKPLRGLGMGVIGAVAAPVSWFVALGVIVLVAVVFGLLSLGGLTGLTLLAGLPALGIVAFAILFVVGYLSLAIVSYLGGQFVLARARPAWNHGVVNPVLAGTVILGILFAVPVLGGWVQFLAVLAGIGALVMTLSAASAATRAPSAPTASTASEA